MVKFDVKENSEIKQLTNNKQFFKPYWTKSFLLKSNARQKE